MNKPKTLFKCIVGSQAYGTSTPHSDMDYKGIYAQHPDDLLTFEYKEQQEISKDECYYEIRRFLELARTANPTILEMLYSNDDCILEKNPALNILFENRDKFLTKKCLHSFGGYAIQQIQKASGLDKKMNWEKQRVTRKKPIDFCYAYESGKTMQLLDYIEKHDLNQKYCGLVALHHFKDSYALYYDFGQEFKYKGISMDTSNSIRLSSVEKDTEPLTIIYYNKDGYAMHCRDFKEYGIWKKNHNKQRYVDVKGHNQKLDGKNLLHTRRLLDMAIEIATEGTINVRRKNSDYLLDIRRGNYDLKKIIEEAKNDVKKLDELFEKSSLPENVDQKFINDILLEIRKNIKWEQPA
jgi:hypothetical protein